MLPWIENLKDIIINALGLRIQVLTDGDIVATIVFREKFVIIDLSNIQNSPIRANVWL